MVKPNYVKLTGGFFTGKLRLTLKLKGKAIATSELPLKYMIELLKPGNP